MTVARVINFILSVQLLVLSSIAKICPATILCYSTDFELVILVSLTHTYCMVMIPQPVSQSCGIPLTVKHIIGMYQLAGHS